jgi:hypothetical protein
MGLGNDTDHRRLQQMEMGTPTLWTVAHAQRRPFSVPAASSLQASNGKMMEVHHQSSLLAGSCSMVVVRSYQGVD